MFQPDAGKGMSEPVHPVLFADFVCPFSHVTEAALRRWAEGTGARIEHRAYELFPAPAELGPPPDIEALPESFHELAAAEGLTLRTPSRRPRTRKAHEAAAFAEEKGRGAVMRAALFRAYFEHDRDLGRIDVLVSCALESGLDETEVKVSLDIDRYTDRVVRESLDARRMGVQGTPALLLPGPARPTLVAGAQPYEEIERLLKDF